MTKQRSIYLFTKEILPQVYSPEAQSQVTALTENDGVIYSTESILNSPKDFKDVEIVFGGWGAPLFDKRLLQALPSLKAIFYAGGSVRGLVTEALWERDIYLTSAYRANAIPVAEYTLASIIFALKKTWSFNRTLKLGGDRESIDLTDAGAYKPSSIGLISLGAIGQLVAEKLQAFDLAVQAFDPFANESVFTQYELGRADSLETLFESSNVVSLHTPLLDETRGLIGAEHFRRMRKGATFINTSRGAVVKEPELAEVLRERPDLFAVIDVIIDESDYSKSALFKLPNVFLTPHIAGSMGHEMFRLGGYAVEECRRYLCKEPPITRIQRENMAMLA